jgi:hypothetical protein
MDSELAVRDVNLNEDIELKYDYPAGNPDDFTF